MHHVDRQTPPDMTAPASREQASKRAVAHPGHAPTTVRKRCRKLSRTVGRNGENVVQHPK